MFTVSSGAWNLIPFLSRLMFALNSTILTPSGGVDNQFFAGTVATGAILATAAIYYVLGSKDKEHDFPRLRGIQFYHAWNFFQQRYDFLQSNFQRNLGKSFSFKVVHHNVVALTGEDARQVFFSDPHLNFDQGYKILMGTVRAFLPRSLTSRFTLRVLGATAQRRGHSDRGERGWERHYL